MLIFLSSCAEKQIEKLSSNDLNENFKPRVLENSSNTPLNTSINTKKTSDSKLISDEEETNRKRVTKIYQSSSLNDNQFSDRFLKPEVKLKKQHKNSIFQKDIENLDYNKDQGESLNSKNDNDALTYNKNQEEEPSISKNEPNLKLTPEISNSKIKVGLLLPLSGSNAELGTAMLNAATLAIFDLSDENFELLPRDTGGTPAGSINAINELISNGAEMILGPVFSNSVKAISPIVQSANITVIAFSNDSSISEKNIYLLGFSPEQQIERIVSFANTQGIINYAAVVPESAYGEKIIKAIEKYIPMYGGRLNKLEKYDIKQGDYRDVIKKITDYEERKKLLIDSREKLLTQGDPVALKALERLEEKETMGEVNFEAILIPEGGARLRSIAPLLAFYDVDPRSIKILGTGLWDEPGIGLEPALVGGWFAGPSPEVGESFRKKYRKVYSTDPHRLASLSYDATALAIVLSRNSNQNSINLSILQNSSGFTGVDGLFRFNKEGLAERGLAVLEINKKGLKIINPSPQVFNVLN
ncbi:MAG: Penicillin-binding protein activator LpoA [Alphaproteobacteria bacterium MarineAlpha2_Bin1]|nr:MAG: Penicillin-binding protein activator LpoA [Alphaproteobacteria bacterium MarineAlpha2_Bin1]